MTTNKRVRKTEFGFYQLAELPDKQFLQKYYTKKYFQQETNYKSEYLPEEISYLRNEIREKHYVLKERMPDLDRQGVRLLEIGAGEGWTIDQFTQQGWDVLGVDFSDYSIKRHNPSVLPSLRVGDPERVLDELAQEGEKFDVIWLDNVLEHLIEPAKMIDQCTSVAAEDAMMVVEVPNDFSRTQQHLLESGDIDDEFWISKVEHLSYFSKDTLANLCSSRGWWLSDALADYPIDFHLFNPDTNYIRNKEAGKNCHRTRVKVDNFLHSLSLEKTVALYRVMADLGIGRGIAAFFRNRENAQ